MTLHKATLDLCTNKRSWKESYWLNTNDWQSAAALLNRLAKLRVEVMATESFVRYGIVCLPDNERQSWVAIHEPMYAKLNGAFGERDSGITGLSRTGAPPGSIHPEDMLVNSAPSSMGVRFNTAAGKWVTRQFRGVPDCFIQRDKWRGPAFEPYDPAGVDLDLGENTKLKEFYSRFLHFYCRHCLHVKKTKVDGVFTFEPNPIVQYAFTGVTDRKTSKKAVL